MLCKAISRNTLIGNELIRQIEKEGGNTCSRNVNYSSQFILFMLFFFPNINNTLPRKKNTDVISKGTNLWKILQIYFSSDEIGPDKFKSQWGCLGVYCCNTFILRTIQLGGKTRHLARTVAHATAIYHREKGNASVILSWSPLSLTSWRAGVMSVIHDRFWGIK